MVPLFGTRSKITTLVWFRGCSVELQGSSKVGIQDTLVFLICLLGWGGRLFLKGDRRLNFNMFNKEVYLVYGKIITDHYDVP